MPVDVPDPAVHKICMRCRGWFHPDEGQLTVPEATGPVSGMRLTAAQFAEDDSGLRFTCHQCARKRRIGKALIWASFAIALGVAFFVAWLRNEF